MLLLFFIIQLLYPSDGPIQAMLATSIDVVILIWQRAMVLRNKPKFATWASMITAALITTVGLHLGGGFITLSFGVYLILIWGAAFVFWQRTASYWMTAIVSILFSSLAAMEISGVIPPNNPAFQEVYYNLEDQTRLLFANILFGIILMLVAMFFAGKSAETLGNWSITLSKEVENKTIQLAELLENMELTYSNIVGLLARVIEARDQYTLDHSHRISTLAMKTARTLNYEEASLERVRLAAILHDIGKIGVPDHILNKPGPLSKKEREIMMRHPDIGADIIATIDELSDIAEVARTHQERYDGTGYPKGLRGEEIPLTARIIAVVDAYIAMKDERPYKAAKSEAFAIKELIDHTGKQFDPQVVDAFLFALQKENTRKDESY